MPILKKMNRKRIVATEIPCPPVGALVEITRTPRKRSTRTVLKTSTGPFETSLRKVFKSLNADKSLKIGSSTIDILDSMVVFLATKIATQANVLSSYNKMKTITQQHAGSAISMVLHGSLAKSANDASNRAHVVFDRVSKLIKTSELAAGTSDKAQLILSVPRVRTIIKTNSDKDVGLPTAIMVAAALEFVVTDLLDTAITKVKESSQSVVHGRHIQAIAESDEEYKRLFKNASFISC